MSSQPDLWHSPAWLDLWYHCHPVAAVLWYIVHSRSVACSAQGLSGDCLPAFCFSHCKASCCLVLCPTDFRFLSCPQFWFLSPLLSGATVLCFTSSLLCCSWKLSLNRDLGQGWSWAREFPVSWHHKLGLPVVVPADRSLMYFVQFIVAYRGRSSYSIVAGSWNPPRESRLLNTWKTRLFMISWERIEKL